MRKITALLLVLATVFPSRTSAQVKVGVVAEAGLSVSAAPAPALSPAALSPAALSLPPAALSVARLSPVPAAPAPLAAPLAASLLSIRPAASLVPVARAVPAALSAITPAAPDKPGSETARAAGTALFDGAERLPAPASGDGPRVLSSSARGRASGLRQPTYFELWSAYREMSPASKVPVILDAGFAARAVDVVTNHTYGKTDPHRDSTFDFAGDLVAAHDARDNPSARRFIRLLGRWSAFRDQALERIVDMKIARMKAAGKSPAPRLPPSPIEGGEYWDMATGINGRSLIPRELDPKTSYSFFDASPYVASYLETTAELAGAANVRVVEGDINALTRPAKPLAVLRAKNAVRYVPDFDRKLEKMADWIAVGGQLVIQNDPGAPQRAAIVLKHGALIRRLLSEGWGFEAGFSGHGGKFGGYAFDTIVLTRPEAPATRSALDVELAWEAYETGVEKLGALSPAALIDAAARLPAPAIGDGPLAGGPSNALVLRRPEPLAERNDGNPASDRNVSLETSVSEPTRSERAWGHGLSGLAVALAGTGLQAAAYYHGYFLEAMLGGGLAAGALWGRFQWKKMEADLPPVARFFEAVAYGTLVSIMGGVAGAMIGLWASIRYGASITKRLRDRRVQKALPEARVVRRDRLLKKPEAAAPLEQDVAP